MSIIYRGYTSVKVSNNILYLFHFNDPSEPIPYTNWYVYPSDVSLVTGEYQFGKSSLPMGVSSSTRILRSGYSEVLTNNENLSIDFWIYLVNGTGTICKWNNNFTITANNNTSITYDIKGVKETKTVANMKRWRHHAIVYNTSTKKITFYCHGLKQTETSITLLEGGSNTLEFSGFDGYLDELKVARTLAWTNDFTPPSEEYKEYSYTQEYVEKEIESGVRDLARLVEDNENPVDVGYRNYQFM